MNAKITITVPIAELPQKIASLLLDVSKKMSEIESEINICKEDVINELDYLNVIENLDSCRKKLAVVDSNIEDCYNILGGLARHKINSSLQENENANLSTK